MSEPTQASTLVAPPADASQTHDDRAQRMLESVGSEGCKHAGRILLLSWVLSEHPTARLVKIPHQPGQGYDQTKERRGKCNRIGDPTPDYQLWADWSEPEKEAS
jgi:hypothetical protein